MLREVKEANGQSAEQEKTRNQDQLILFLEAILHRIVNYQWRHNEQKDEVDENENRANPLPKEKKQKATKSDERLWIRLNHKLTDLFTLVASLEIWSIYHVSWEYRCAVGSRIINLHGVAMVKLQNKHEA